MKTRDLAAGLLVNVTRLVTGVTARWVDCEASVRQRVYYANHSSHLDSLVIWAALPPAIRVRARPIAARDYWERTRLRRYLAREVFRAVLIDRTSLRKAKEAVDQIVEALGNDDSLILFPEGTRGDGVHVGEFKTGLYHVAKMRSDVELVPVYLENLSRVLPKGEVLPVPILGGATFGRPLKLEDGETKMEFTARARNALLALGEPHARDV